PVRAGLGGADSIDRSGDRVAAARGNAAARRGRRLVRRPDRDAVAQAIHGFRADPGDAGEIFDVVEATAARGPRLDDLGGAGGADPGERLEIRGGRAVE